MTKVTKKSGAKKSGAVSIRLGGKSQYLEVRLLHVEPSAQRTLRPSWAQELADNFNPELFGQLHVSHRADGRYFIIDGQHRVDALRRMGWDDQTVPCVVYEGLTLPQEAALFKALNEGLAVRTFDKFRIAITAGEPIPCDIKRIVEAEGLVLSDQKRNGGISAVSSLRFIYMGAGLTKENPEALTRTLRFLKRCWGDASTAFEGTIMEGMALLLLRHRGNIDEDALATKLAKAPGGALGILGKARGLHELSRGAVKHCVAAVLTDLYNLGRRKDKLPDWWASK